MACRCMYLHVFACICMHLHEEVLKYIKGLWYILMNELHETIGKNIRYERERYGLTIDEMASILGLSAGFLGLLERGERGTKLENLLAIANVFNVPVYLLLKNRDEEYVPDVGGKADKLNILCSCLSPKELDFVTSTVKMLIEIRNNV